MKEVISIVLGILLIVALGVLLFMPKDAGFQKTARDAAGKADTMIQSIRTTP